MMIPTVHLNGTSKADLVKQYAEARLAVRNAIEALAAANPNARDYYPQGDRAYSAAAKQHARRIQLLAEVSEELSAIYLGIQEQGR